MNSIDRHKQTPIETTYMYLNNYSEMKRYVNEAISEYSQIDDIAKYNISAEAAFLQSIRECRTETIILLEHIDKALESLKEDAEKAGEVYKYNALIDHHIKGISYERIAEENNTSRNTSQRWCSSMAQRLTLKLFGAKAFDNKWKIRKVIK